MINDNISFNFLVFIIFFETIILILFSFIKFGFGFNYRDLFLQDRFLLTIFNIWNASFIAIYAMMIIRYLQERSKVLLCIIIFISLLSIFTGSRGTLFFTLINSYIFYIISLKKKLNFLKIFIYLFIFLFLFFIISNLRQGGGESSEGSSDFLLFSFFYGNNFSDLRDTAWIVASWDKGFLYGKTYLAGLLSFVPTSLIPFREHYNLAQYTNDLVDLDSRTHPGIRPIVGFEAYLNFGFFGVVSLGFLIGYINRFIDLKLKSTFSTFQNSPDYIKMYSISFLNIVILRFYNTGGFWLLYVFIGIITFC